MPADEQPEEPRILRGPDPRNWKDSPGTEDDPEIWGLVQDIEAVERAQRALIGSTTQQAGEAIAPARRFLAHVLDQRRGLLALRILETYDIPVPEDQEDPGPFAGAGKPRAFGAEQQPPQPQGPDS